MRTLFLIVACFFVFNTQGQKTDTTKAKTPKYEMKQYWFVMLIKGKDRDKITDTAVLNKLQAGHIANLQRLADMSKINVAGPLW